MKRRPTVTIGIPAHNEAQNIGQLLVSLIEQTQKGFVLEKILVHSDASTDKTDAIVKRMRSELISLKRHSRRIGKPAITNRIIQSSTSDILIIIDADVLLADKDFLLELTKPIITQKADLTSANVIALPPKTWVERVLAFSTDMKAELYKHLKRGNSVYTCHGRARAFSKQFYKIFESKAEVVADDAYSYLVCRRLGLKYIWAEAATLYYRLPQTLTDHLHQSRRFFQSQQQLSTHFPKRTIQEAYRIPLRLTLKTLGEFALKSPVLMVGYICILFISKYQSAFQPSDRSRWQVATSSKALA